MGDLHIIAQNTLPLELKDVCMDILWNLYNNCTNGLHPQVLQIMTIPKCEQSSEL